MSLPTFTRVGKALTKPAAMTSGPLFFRVFDNDAHRALPGLSGLPTEKYSGLYSTDHGTGEIWRCDFDDPETLEYTPTVAAIHTGGTQRETPLPLYNPVSGLIDVFVSDATSSSLYGLQSTRRLTTPNLLDLTDTWQVMLGAHHSGYADVVYENGVWCAISALYGGPVADSAVWSTSDVTDFGDPSFLSSSRHDIFGEGKIFLGKSMLDYNGKRYLVGSLVTQPSSSNVATAYIAYEVNPTTLLPVGTGYWTLLLPGTGDDVIIHNSLKAYVLGGTLYLYYIGRDVTGLINSVMLAKGVAGTEATFTSFTRKPMRGTRATTVFTWDAANDAVPAGITPVVVSGTNASNQSAGNWYRVQTSSGSTQGIQLQGTDTFDPRDHEAIGFKLTGFRLDPTTDYTKVWWMLGCRDNPQTPVDGTAFYWQFSSWEHGRFLEHKGGVAVSTTAYAMSYAHTTVSPWLRNFELDSIEMLWLDQGTKVALMVNNQCVFLKSPSNTTLAPFKPFIRVSSVTSPFPAFYAEFESWELISYTNLVSRSGRLRKLYKAAASQNYKG